MLSCYFVLWLCAWSAPVPFSVSEVRHTLPSAAGLPHYLVCFTLDFTFWALTLWSSSLLGKLVHGMQVLCWTDNLDQRWRGWGECISAVNKHRADYQVLCVVPVWHSELTVCTPRSQGKRVDCLRVWEVRTRPSGAFHSNCLRKSYDIVRELSKWMIWVLPRLWESWAH